MVLKNRKVSRQEQGCAPARETTRQDEKEVFACVKNPRYPMRLAIFAVLLALSFGAFAVSAQGTFSTRCMLPFVGPHPHLSFRALLC